MNKIEKTIQYSAEDLQNAYAVHFKKMYPLKSKVVLILGIILVFLGFLMVFLQSMAGVITWLSWFFVLYGILVVIYYFWRFNRMGKIAFKKLVDFHYPFSYTITAEGVNMIGKNVSSNNTWDYYQSVLITSQIIILYPNKLRFILLPKKYFSDKEFEQLTEWVKEKVIR